MPVKEYVSLYDTPLDLWGGLVHTLKATFLDHPVIKVAGTCLVMLCGELDRVYLALVVALSADLITGILAALYTRTFQCHKLRNAVYKWLVYWLLIVLAHQGGYISDYLRWMGEATAIFLFIVEYNSIAGNLNKMGFNVPTFEKLGAFIDKLRKIK